MAESSIPIFETSSEERMLNALALASRNGQKEPILKFIPILVNINTELIEERITDLKPQIIALLFQAKLKKFVAASTAAARTHFIDKDFLISNGNSPMNKPTTCPPETTGFFRFFKKRQPQPTFVPPVIMSARDSDVDIADFKMFFSP